MFGGDDEDNESIYSPLKENESSQDKISSDTLPGSFH